MSMSKLDMMLVDSIAGIANQTIWKPSTYYQILGRMRRANITIAMDLDVGMNKHHNA